MTTVLLDCDDVLLDWAGGFAKHASTQLGHEITGQPCDWAMHKWLGCEEKEVPDLIEDFNRSDAFGQLEPVAGAVEACLELRQRNRRLHVITSCSSDAFTIMTRRMNLEQHFGPIFDSVHCLDLGESKERALRAFRAGAVWVEDNYKNAMLGARCGHTTFLLERPHNAKHREVHTPNVTWVNDWHEIRSNIA